MATTKRPAKNQAEPAPPDGTPTEEVVTTEWKPSKSAILIADGEDRKYWHRSPGEVISGDITDYVRIDGDAVFDDGVDEESLSEEERRARRTFFVVQVDRPCHFVLSKDETIYTSRRGDLVYVGVTYDLKPTIKYATSSYVHNVQIQAKDRKNLGGDPPRKVWRHRIEVSATGRRKARPERMLGDGTTPIEPESITESEDIPF